MLATIPTDYARNLARLADSIERAPESPDIRASWVAALIDTCPMASGPLRTYVLALLGRASMGGDREASALRAASYVVRRVPM